MLFGKEFRWCHDGGLYAAGNRLQACDCGDNRFSGADIALNQSKHRIRRCNIVRDLADNTLLGSGQLVRQSADKALSQFRAFA